MARNDSADNGAICYATTLPLEPTCLRVIGWLEKMADAMEKQAKDSRHPSLVEACRADIANYRATAKSIRKDIEKAKGE